MAEKNTRKAENFVSKGVQVQDLSIAPFMQSDWEKFCWQRFNDLSYEICSLIFRKENNSAYYKSLCEMRRIYSIAGSQSTADKFQKKLLKQKKKEIKNGI